MAEPAPTACYDPYVISSDGVREPPTTLRQALRKIGPGMILAASIVGTGELIATTHAGAKAEQGGAGPGVGVGGGHGHTTFPGRS